MSQSQIFRSRDDLVAFDLQPHAREAGRWPRVPCFAAAVVVSLGLWAGLIDVAVKLVAWLG